VKRISIGKVLYKVQNVNMQDYEELTKTIIRLLGEDKCFPFHVFWKLYSFFLTLEINNDELLLLHARECLDNIAFAVMSILPPIKNMDTLRDVTNIVDLYTLRINEAIFYNKVFASCIRLSEKKDEQLKYLSISADHSIAFNGINDALQNVSSKYTGMDKLFCLVKALQVISTDISFLATERKGDKDVCEHQDFDVNADELINKTISALIINVNQSNTSQWNAECVFINAMVREGSWLLGITCITL
jgi:hypothetical protein